MLLPSRLSHLLSTRPSAQHFFYSTDKADMRSSWVRHNAAERGGGWVQRLGQRPAQRLRMRAQDVSRYQRNMPARGLRMEAVSVAAGDSSSSYVASPTAKERALLAMSASIAALGMPPHTVSESHQEFAHMRRALLAQERVLLFRLENQLSLTMQRLEVYGRTRPLVNNFFPAGSLRTVPANFLNPSELALILSRPTAERFAAYSGILAYKDAATHYVLHHLDMCPDYDIARLVDVTPELRVHYGAQLLDQHAYGASHEAARIVIQHILLGGGHIAHAVMSGAGMNGFRQWRARYVESAVAGRFDDILHAIGQPAHVSHVGFMLLRGLRGVVPTGFDALLPWIYENVASYCAAHCLYDAVLSSMDSDLASAGIRGVMGYLPRPDAIWLAMPHGEDSSRRLLRHGMSERIPPLPGEPRSHAQLRNLLKMFPGELGWAALRGLAQGCDDTMTLAMLTDIAAVKLTTDRAPLDPALNMQIMRTQRALQMALRRGLATVNSPQVKRDIVALYQKIR